MVQVKNDCKIPFFISDIKYSPYEREWKRLFNFYFITIMKKVLTLCTGISLMLGISNVMALDLSSALTTSQKLLENNFLSWASSLQEKDELILKLHKKGFTIYKTWSSFSPDKTIRRDEAAKMLTLALDFLPQPIGFVEGKDCSFSDTENARSDLRPLLTQSCEKGLFKWSKWLFRPDESITNGQIMTVLGRMLFGMQVETNGHYASAYVKLLQQNNYLPDPFLANEKSWDQAAKRATLAELLAKVVQD